MARKSLLSKFGPGAIVAAAFIGPGTIGLCTKSGITYGYDLLWVMLIAIGGTYILQEITVRMTLATNQGIIQSIGRLVKTKPLKQLFFGAIFISILIGNTAFEAGNIAGGAIGVELLYEKTSQINDFIPLIIGIVASVILFIGNYKTIERFLIVLVMLMSISFLLTAIITLSQLSALFSGFIPSTPSGSFYTIVGLIGTTIVPYNLFLHASSVREKWSGVTEIKTARKDAFIAILIGGLVSMSVIIAAAAAQGANFDKPQDLAIALTPLFGESAKYFLGIGLLAAGLTSAITAPLAAAYVGSEVFGWKSGMKNPRFKIIWFFVLSVGVYFSSTGTKPLEIIQFAQFLNGILLPFIAIVLLWAINQRQLMGKFTNTGLQNIGAAIVILFALFISIKTFIHLFSNV